MRRVLRTSPAAVAGTGKPPAMIGSVRKGRTSCVHRRGYALEDHEVGTFITRAHISGRGRAGSAAVAGRPRGHVAGGDCPSTVRRIAAGEVLVQAVVLDIGGVLENTPATGWEVAWERRLGLEPGGLIASVEHLLEPGELGEASYEEIVEEVAGALGLDGASSAALWDDLWAEYLGTLNGRLLRYVDALRPAVKVGLLSNSFVGAREREEAAYGFSRHVDVIVYSHEEGLKKPDPAFYRRACERLAFAPTDVVFVDDHQVCVDAARDLGMTGVLFTTEEETIAELHERLRGRR